MTRRVVTISREYGSGGRDVGERVAERLGVAFYDKGFIARVAEKSGLDPAYIAEFGEYATSTSGFVYNLELHGGFSGGGMSVPDQLYVVQHNAILELAENEPCVIVGRCADYALQDRTDCLHVFLHADRASRIDRIVRIYGESGEDAEKRLDPIDGKRKVYYEHYTGRTWGMAENYHLALDSGALGVDACVDVIVDLARR